MLRSLDLRLLVLGALLTLPVGCGSMRANRSVRAAGYPVQQTGVRREMGKKTVYVYIGRPVTEQERQDIKVRVLGAVPNATEVVVYPLPGTAVSPAAGSTSTARPNTPAGGQAPAGSARPNGTAPAGSARPNGTGTTPGTDPNAGQGATPGTTPGTTPNPGDTQTLPSTPQESQGSADSQTPPAGQPRPNMPQAFASSAHRA